MKTPLAPIGFKSVVEQHIVERDDIRHDIFMGEMSFIDQS